METNLNISDRQIIKLRMNFLGEHNLRNIVIPLPSIYIYKSRSHNEYAAIMVYSYSLMSF